MLLLQVKCSGMLESMSVEERRLQEVCSTITHTHWSLSYYRRACVCLMQPYGRCSSIDVTFVLRSLWVDKEEFSVTWILLGRFWCSFVWQCILSWFYKSNICLCIFCRLLSSRANVGNIALCSTLPRYHQFPVTQSYCCFCCCCRCCYCICVVKVKCSVVPGMLCFFLFLFLLPVWVRMK